MNVANACDWVIARLLVERSFFTVRINDGDMIQMFRAKPEGALLGTYANPAYCHWGCGDEYREMLSSILCGPYPDVLVGHCCHDDPDHELNRRFWADYGFGLNTRPEAGGHWPLDGVVDGSTIRLLTTLRTRRTVMVTCQGLVDARKCFGADGYVLAPTEDSWEQREEIYRACRPFAAGGYVFVWCAGGGLKPTAWRLWREFPQSSHLDLGHLFNGAMGLKDYGWLERGDGPWHSKYFSEFAPWVRSFLP